MGGPVRSTALGGVDPLLFFPNVSEVYVTGWACLPEADEPLEVRLQLDAPSSSGGQLLVTGVANVVNEPAVAQVCGSSSPHRFQLPLTSAQRIQFAGRVVFAEALRSGDAGSLGVLASSAHVPARTRVRVDDYVSETARSLNARPGIQAVLDAAVASSTASNEAVEVEFGPHPYRLDCPEAQPRIQPGCTMSEAESPKACLVLRDAGGTLPGRVVLSGVPGTRLVAAQSLAAVLRAERLGAVALHQLELDHEALPYTQGTVQKVGDFWLKVTPSPGYSQVTNEVCDCINKRRAPDKWRVWGIGLDPSTRKPRTGLEQPPGTLHEFFLCGLEAGGVAWLSPYPNGGRGVEGLDARFLAGDPSVQSTIRSEMRFFRNGDGLIHLLGGNYLSSAIYLSDGGTVDISRVKVRSAGGPAFLLTGTRTRIVLSDSEVRPPAQSDRLLSTNGDGIHLQDNRALTKLLFNRMGRMADDGINGYSVPSPVIGVETPTRIWVNEQRAHEVGDFVQIFSPETGEIRAYALVQAVMRAADSSFTRLDLTWASPLASGVLPLDWVANVAKATPGLLVKGNQFEWHRGVDLRLRAPYAMVQDNLFGAINWNGVEVGFMTTDYQEGPIPHGELIISNQFMGGDLLYGHPLEIGGVTSGRAVGGPHQIAIQDNLFCGYRTQDGPVMIGLGVSSVTQSGNISREICPPPVVYRR